MIILIEKRFNLTHQVIIGMEKSLRGMLCCPYCKGSLTTDRKEGHDATVSEQLYCQACNKHYTCNSGYWDFLSSEQSIMFNSRREKIVRSIYTRVYTPVTNFMFLFCGGVKNARNEVLSHLHLNEGSSVLETGMGYGHNFLWLSEHAGNLKLYGLDIQKEMMDNCAANLLKWKISAEIVRGDAHSLPFKDESFDVVFHLGAINLFADKKAAIEEMIRVAKPGTHIVIADETEKAGRLFKIFTGPAAVIIPPLDLVPFGVNNKKMSTIWRGYGYLIEFDKP